MSVKSIMKVCCVRHYNVVRTRLRNVMSHTSLLIVGSYIVLAVFVLDSDTVWLQKQIPPRYPAFLSLMQYSHCSAGWSVSSTNSLPIRSYLSVSTFNGRALFLHSGVSGLSREELTANVMNRPSVLPLTLQQHGPTPHSRGIGLDRERQVKIRALEYRTVLEVLKSHVTFLSVLQPDWRNWVWTAGTTQPNQGRTSRPS